MKHIFNKTYSKMFTYVVVGIVVAISVFSGFFLASDYLARIQSNPTFEYFTQRLVILYSLMTFVLVSGLSIWMIVANTSSGLFANELHEGTLRLLLAKPVSRRDLVIGKIGGMLAGGMTYLVLSLMIVLSVFSLKAHPDQDILIHLLKYTGVYILYGTFMILIAGSIGTFLSTCFKKKVPALLILALIGFLIFGIIPIVRLMMQTSGIYNRMHLYLFDLNYHLALIFDTFTNLLGQMTGTSSQLELYNMFTNLFHYVPLDMDVALKTGTVMVANNTLNGVLVTAVYGIIGALLYGLSFKRMEIKDIS